MHQELGEIDNKLFNKFKNYRIFNHSFCNLRITNITKGINQRLKCISKEYNILKKASEKKEKKNIYNYLNLSKENKYKRLRKKRTKFPTFVRLRPSTVKSKLLRLESIHDTKKKTFCIDLNKHKLKMRTSVLGLVPNFPVLTNYNNNNNKDIKFSPNSSIYSRNTSVLNNEFTLTKNNNNSYYQNFDIFKQLNNDNNYNVNNNNNINNNKSNNINNINNNINNNNIIINNNNSINKSLRTNTRKYPNVKVKNNIPNPKNNKKKKKKINFKKYIPHPIYRKLNDALSNSNQLKKELLINSNSFSYKDPLKLTELLKVENNNSFEKKINKNIFPYFESYPLKNSKNSPFRTIFPSIDYLENLNLYKRITNLNPISSYKFKDEIKKEMEIKIITKGFAQINFVPNNYFQYAYKRPEWVIEKTKKSREKFENIIWKTDKNNIGGHTIN